MRTYKLITAALMLACLLTAALSPRPSSAAADCEGDACSSVTVTFDEVKQQYRVQNGSQDRWARVSVSNLAAAVSTCIGPGMSLYLPLKSVVPPYRASFAEVKCGEEETSE